MTPTLTDPATWTPDFVDDQLRRICAEHPDATNPRLPDGACAYQIDDRHCLIGQLLHKAGKLTDEIVKQNRGADILYHSIGCTRKVAWRLHDWQGAADHIAHGYPLLTWQAVPDAVRPR